MIIENEYNRQEKIKFKQFKKQFNKILKDKNLCDYEKEISLMYLCNFPLGEIEQKIRIYGIEEGLNKYLEEISIL